MLVIALVSQKGGGGKTTLAVAFAVAHERVAGGGGAVVVDLDPQGSASMWGGLRPPDADPPVIDATPRSLARTLAHAEGAGTGLAVVDTPPQLAAAAREASRLADLVLVPCRAAAADLHAVVATLTDVCRAAGAGRRCWIVLNAMPPRGPLAREARETVEDSLVARVAPESRWCSESPTCTPSPWGGPPRKPSHRRLPPGRRRHSTAGR